MLLEALATVVYLLPVAQCSSLLFSGGTILAFDDGTESVQVMRNASLLVTDDRIVQLFDQPSPQDVPDETETIDCTDKIISPGFVDTHRHGWQTGLKTIGSNTSLAEYFARFGEYAAQPYFTAEDVYIGELAGFYEALNAGTTTSLDFAHCTWSNDTSRAGFEAAVESGARVYWSYAFHNVTNFTIPEQIANYRDLVATVATPADLVVPAMAYDGFSSNPYGEYTASVIELARDTNASVLTSHSLGGPFANENDPELFQTLGILNTSMPVILAHASFLTARGASLLRSANQYISITPESEMHYGHTHPHSYYIQDQASLGVDTHFTFSLDMMTQARIWLQQMRYTLMTPVLDRWEEPANNPMSTNQAFQLATRHGGLALRRPDLGVIAPGAKADLVVLDGRSPALLGWDDPVAAVVLHAGAADVEHVLVDGHFRKRDGRLVVPDYPAVQDRFLASARRLQAAWAAMPPSTLDGIASSGFPYGRALEVDALRGPGTGYGQKHL